MPRRARAVAGEERPPIRADGATHSLCLKQSGYCCGARRLGLDTGQATTGATAIKIVGADVKGDLFCHIDSRYFVAFLYAQSGY